MYDIDSFNDDVIDLQVIPSRDLLNLVNECSEIKHKHKYKFIGFPRLDLAYNQELLKKEASVIHEKYKLSEYKKVYFYVSSFLFNHPDISDKDNKVYDMSTFKKRTDFLLEKHKEILFRFVQEYLKKDELLMIKKHPWDDSSFFKDNFQAENCIIIEDTEYITPCIMNADFIIHKYSTSAVEAWILDKPTIAILPPMKEEGLVKPLNHMEDEVIVSTYEEMIEKIEDYPLHSKSFLQQYIPHNDGLATKKLAELITNLKPKENKTAFPAPKGIKQFSNTLRHKNPKGKYPVLSNEEIKQRMESARAKSARLYRLYFFELLRPEVDAIYCQQFREFVNNNL